MKNVQKENRVPAWLVVAVVDSRSVRSCSALVARLEELARGPQLLEIVSGGAAGVDGLAASWARATGTALTEVLPSYTAHGPAAPLVRNAAIVAAADLVLVVWDGQSLGTLDAARKAARLGKPLEWLAAPAPDTAPVPGGLGL